MVEPTVPAPWVSAILVSWNTRELLAEALASLPSSVGGGRVEVLVVDNASSDGSPTLVRERFPEARLICNTVNLGFAQANNQAFAQAGGSYWLLLNSDARLLPGCLEALLEPMRVDPACAVVGARLVFPDGRFQASYNDFPDFGHELLSLAGLARRVYGPWFPSHRDGDGRAGDAVDWVSGACMLLRAEAVRAVGGFDESFPFYSEEMDLCKRLAAAGWNVQYAPAAGAVHHGGGSTGPRSAEQARLLWSSRIRYHRKHASPTTARLLPPLVRGAYLARALWWGLRASGTRGDQASAWQARSNGAWTVVREL